MSNRPARIALVGAGVRGMTYASYALEHPDEMDVVAVADPDADRRNRAAHQFNIPGERCFGDARGLTEVPRCADAVINATMDHLHVSTALPLLEKGYHMLLEKPIAQSAEGLARLLRAARENNAKVIIAHVLRYSPFYRSIYRELEDGVIGTVTHIECVQQVSYHHMAVAYLRGKWGSDRQQPASMLMAKSCHDLDIIAWFQRETVPVSVASRGNNLQFRPENAPDGAGERCLVDCEVEDSCIYSARKHYIDHPEWWRYYVWRDHVSAEDPSREEKIASLKADNPYGRCVWDVGADVVDHQSVLIEFADGSTATYTMTGGSARPSRSIRVMGTKGEIEGEFEDSTYVVRRIEPGIDHDYTERRVELDIEKQPPGSPGASHGGGDVGLVADFVRILHDRPVSESSALLQDSLTGHLIGYCAERSRESGGTVQFPADTSDSLHLAAGREADPQSLFDTLD